MRRSTSSTSASLRRWSTPVVAGRPIGCCIAACPVDVRLADGERFFLGQRSLQALHLPGHSPGSVAYLVESDGRRVVFAQDVHGPLHPDLLSKRSDYQASLRKLLALQADILCEGHYGVFVGRAAVAAFIERFVED